MSPVHKSSLETLLMILCDDTRASWERVKAGKDLAAHVLKEVRDINDHEKARAIGAVRARAERMHEKARAKAHALIQQAKRGEILA